MEHILFLIKLLRFLNKWLTNKDRLCEQREPQSYPVLDKPGAEVDALIISKYLFFS